MEPLPSSGLSHEFPELGWNWLKGNAWKWQHHCVSTPCSAGTRKRRKGDALHCLLPPPLPPAPASRRMVGQGRHCQPQKSWGRCLSRDRALQCSRPAPCSALAVGMWQWSPRETWALQTGPSTARCWPWAPVFINRPVPCRKPVGGSCGAEVVCFPFLALNRTGYF